MAAPRMNRVPIALAMITLVILISLWHGRDNLPSRPLHYIKGKLPLKRPTFLEIGTKYGTDKVTAHHYDQMYEHRLGPWRDKRIKMLEIGLGCDMSYGPGASYYTWLEFFTDVDLYYIEYNAECAKNWANKTKDATIFTGDQGDVAFLQQFIKEAGSDWDVIVDDGGHTMSQQRTSLKVLWPEVKAGGIYFIEDLATSYSPAHGGSWGNSDTMMGDLKAMLDDINRVGGMPQGNPASIDVISFEFTQECVALTKRQETDALQ